MESEKKFLSIMTKIRDSNPNFEINLYKTEMEEYNRKYLIITVKF